MGSLNLQNQIRIGRGHVYHARKEVAAHSFRYPTFFICFECAQEKRLMNLFRNQYLGFLSLKSKDYLTGSSSSLQTSIQEFLLKNCQYEAESVWLHTLPRMFGYAFNPVSFWLCQKNGKLDAVLIEVNNTFGERHYYWVHDPEKLQSQEWVKSEKVFHVSPFFPVNGYYQFRFQLDDTESRIDINYYSEDHKLRLATWVQGKFSSLDSVTVFSILRKYGWMTPMVLVRIHYQALKLFFKKIKFYKKPALPAEEVTS